MAEISPGMRRSPCSRASVPAIRKPSRNTVAAMRLVSTGPKLERLPVQEVHESLDDGIQHERHDFDDEKPLRIDRRAANGHVASPIIVSTAYVVEQFVDRAMPNR